MSALVSAVQGAKLGGQFGGAWGAVGGGIIGLLAGGQAAKREEEMAKNYNSQVVKYAAQDLFDLRRQQNVENIRTAQALASYQENRKVYASSAVAALGAADIIGSSAKALEQTMSYQTDAAIADVKRNWEAGVDTYNRNVDNMTHNRSASLKRSVAEPNVDYGALLSTAVGVYKEFGQGQGENLKEDTKFFYNHRKEYANIAKGLVQENTSSLIGALSTAWNTNVIDRLNASVTK